MDITIFTTTLGREKYVKDLADSINKLTGWQNHNFLHYIIYQGSPTKEFLTVINQLPYKKELIINNGKKKSIGKLMEEFKTICSSEIFWKLDDDALIYTDNAFAHIEELYKLYNPAVFLPYPVGLIEHPGGAGSRGHITAYSKQTDNYYTLRKVGHISGFARIMPTNVFKQIIFTDRHYEDVECSEWCRKNNVPMFTLENTLVVEHRETKYGQYHRYGEDYLKKKLS